MLRIEGLEVSFPSRDGRVTILDNVSFEVFDREIVGLVGESGSGKTMTSLTVMGFLPPSGRIEGGEVWFGHDNLLAHTEEEMRRVRGRQIAMIFQSTRSALNPLMRVGDQVARVYRIQRGLGAREAQAQAIQALARVGLPDAEQRARAYPHQLSRGMCQRVLIAMMVACEPALLIADEPTTGLDVTIQAQIFELIKDVQQATEASILLITHDLGVVAETCDRVVVIYAGQVMETATVESLFAEPVHPYTQRLLHSVLRVDKRVEMPKVDAGLTEEVAYLVAGCRFAPRCPRVQPRCWEEHPPREQARPDHWVTCYNYQ
ncbi:MAG: ATP-binding cassette domain-containing protein [Anaerolineae bacterium]|nr:ATP-binding cassette domain-containing protein [Anaerolineae bacterium]NIN94729.1 ATP-binding cassette domain-containing protein [Anaerolineae bacterium]NIQ77811.1 ATP-binding cassette domain-containing protein [Anaerolineae bacterium]